MSGGFRVTTTALDDHARTVDGLAARVRLAADAGQPLDTAAYGVVGQVFAVAAVGATREGSAAVAHLAGTADRIRDGVRATCTGYTDVEDGTAATFTGPR